MIAYLRGKIEKFHESRVILQLSSGIGYEIFFRPTSDELCACEVGIYISSIHKENGVELYGHRGLIQKKFFEVLLKAKGVGPKTAYLLMENFGVENICVNIIQKNESFFKKAQGIGSKTASQIILDLHKDVDSFIKENRLYEKHRDQTSDSGSWNIVSSALEALESLGYKTSEISQNVVNIFNEKKLTKAEDLVKEVLKSSKTIN